MTKEMKYGVLMMVALLVMVPLFFLLIQVGAGALYLIFTKPLEVLIFIVGTFVGGYLNSKLK